MSFYIIVVLEKKGDIEEAEEKIAEEVSIFKGKLKFTVKGGKYFVVVCRK